jgi:adenine-specific DNA-methyltransferase
VGKKDAEKINLGTDSQLDEIRRKIKDLVPQAFTDGVLNVEFLKQILASTDNEGSRYQLDWSGKDEAFRALQIPSYATLHPDKSSVKFDAAENVFIEGDNLEVLKLLQRAYNDKVKLIYIDPPYNTTNDFVYNDDFTDSLDTYLRYTGQRDSDGLMTSATTESGGRRHSGWLSMMYPRLVLARNLLQQDGAVFVAIDDNEVHNLRLLLDSIFGPENFIAQFVWAAGRKNDSKFVSNSHEYMVCYARNIHHLKDTVGEWRTKKEGLDAIYAQHKKMVKQHKEDYVAITEQMKAWYRSLPLDNPAKRHSQYCEADKNGIYFAGDIAWPGSVGPTYPVMHPKTKKPVKVPAGGWRFPKVETMEEMIRNDRVHFGIDHTTVPKLKRYLRESEEEVPYSVFYQDGRGATKRLRTLLDGDVFENPKDELVLQSIIEFATDKDSLVMDLFAGSGTTGHAVMLQNASDGGTRRFVLVNLPEVVDVIRKPDAKKVKVKTVADITRLRLKKAAAAIGLKDFALKSFTLGESNFKIWNPAAVGDSETEIAKALQLFSDSLVNGAKDDSIAAELLLKEGVPLGQPWERIKVADSDVIRVGSVGMALTRSVSEKFITEILKVDWLEKLLILDAAFDGQDKHKSNLLIGADEAGVIVRVA